MYHRGFTYKLKPTTAQEDQFRQFAGVCRLLWNLALEQRRHHWRNFQVQTGDNLNYVTQSRELTKLRADFDFIRDVSQTCEQYALKSLDIAYQRAFKGLASFPQPKKKGVHEAFTFNGREITIAHINNKWARVRLPKIGWVTFRITRKLVGRPTEVIVALTPLGWYIAINCKIDSDLSDVGGRVGIDRGVAVPLMLSDGTSFNLPVEVAVLERKARKAQRVMARRKRGSRRYAVARKRVAALKAKQARVRKHWAHEVTTNICKKYSTVVIERLRTKNMTLSASGTIETPGVNVAQKRGLNRAILNVGWHQIEALLFYKAKHLIKVNPCYTSQTCSSCGITDSKSRKNQATFVCISCGFASNADHNAALNILNRWNTPDVEPAVKQTLKRKLPSVEITGLQVGEDVNELLF